MTSVDTYTAIPIIILNWNGYDDTVECISALEKQSFQDFIIYLVDNGSDPPEAEKLRAKYGSHPKVRLVFNEENLGFTIGNNRMIEEIVEIPKGRNGRTAERRNGSAQSAVHSRQSTVGSPQSKLQDPGAANINVPKSEIRNPKLKQSEESQQSAVPGLQSNPNPEYIGLLNNDTAPSPQWLEELVTIAKSENADMVSSKMVFYSEPERIDNVGHVLLNTLEVLPMGYDQPADQFTTVMENVGACGGAALYSVKMLREIGIFDERFTNGYEDVELGLRAVLCGYRSVYAPGAVVLHKGSRSINKIRDMQYTVGIQRSIYYIQGKLFPWSVILLCMPFIVFRFVAAFLINLLAFRLKFLRIQITAAYHLFFSDLPVIVRARGKFFREHKVISTRSILGKMRFFWRYDWARFRKYILRREKNVFENY